MRGDRLRDARKVRGFSQEDLARRVGVRGQQIYRYESGENEPTADILARMAQELSVSTDYLLGLTDDPSAHIQEEDLSPAERNLIQALRRGLITEALKSFTVLSQAVEQATIPGDKPSADS